MAATERRWAGLAPAHLLLTVAVLAALTWAVVAITDPAADGDTAGTVQMAASSGDSAGTVEMAAPTDSGAETAQTTTPTRVAAFDPDGDAAEVLAAADPLEVATHEACAQWRAGRTVADFAAWFESGLEEVTDADRDLFRRVVERAIVEECPEVVPDS